MYMYVCVCIYICIYMSSLERNVRKGEIERSNVSPYGTTQD